MQSTEQGQPSTRRPGVVTDQHGRRWATFFDNRSGFPLGTFQAIGWKAPWYPPQGPEVFVCDANNPTRVTINYQYLLDEREAARREVDDSRKAAAAARGWDHLDPEKQDLLDKVAQPRDKTNAPEVIVACMQGNKWILGMTEVVDERVKKYLPVKAKGLDQRLQKYESFAPLDEDLERRLDIEEAHDPEAVGGTKQKLPTRKKPKPAEAA